MNYQTLAQMAEVIRANMHRVPRLPVVGIPRSGLIAASMIATLRDLPMRDLYDLQITEALLVDDSVSGGQTLARMKSIRSDVKWTTLAVYVKPQSPKPDIWFAEIPGPRVFEWNWAKHHYLRDAMLDIDGVLCEESLRVKNWDDLAHVQSVREGSMLLHKPKYRVKAIATGRKEVERPFTEEWLERMGIRYQHIYFSNPQRGARKTKAEAARATGCTWIVESNFEQACFLNDLLKIPVLCTDRNIMLNEVIRKA